MQKKISRWLGVPLALLFLVGCITGQKGALVLVEEHFRSGRFEKCLKEIQQARAMQQLNSDDEAHSFLTEALCYEGLGQQAKADDVYRSIIVKFSDTMLAMRAEQRLQRQEGDQLPNFVPKFDARKWKLQAKKWKSAQFMAQYCLQNQTARTWTECITVLSTDLASPISSVEDKLKQIKEELSSAWPGLEWQILKASRNEAFYYFKCPRAKPECGVGRVVLSNAREHTIVYAARTNDLDSEARDRWVALLGAAELYPLPARDKGADSTSALTARVK